MKQYKYKNKTYSVVHCTLEDIPSHIGKVSSYWKDEELQVSLIKGCVGYKVINSNGDTQAVIYFKRKKYTEAISHLLWVRSKVMFLILGWYLKKHIGFTNIYFQPHNDIPAYSFIATQWSIRTWWSHRTPLRIDLYSDNEEIKRWESLVSKGIVQEI